MEVKTAPLRAIPLPPILIGIGGILLLVGLALVGIQVWSRYQTQQQQGAVDAYTAAVAPAAREAGRLVDVEIVPELRGFSQGTVSAAQVSKDAGAWAAQFDRTRAAFDAAPTPSDLQSVNQRFDRALQEYAAASRLIATAVKSARGDPRLAAAAGVTRFAAAGDEYDSAEHQLVCERHRLGLADVAEFPLKGTC